MDKLQKERKINIGNYLIGIIIILGIGIVIGIFTSPSAQMYKELVRPSFAPPGWVFGVVWPILYVLMAISAVKVYELKKQGVDVGNSLKLFMFQLILNYAWPILFFTLRLYGIAFLDIVLMLIITLVVIIKFFRINKLSAYLLIPYALWLTFAAVLNLSIVVLNQ